MIGAVVAIAAAAHVGFALSADGAVDDILPGMLDLSYFVAAFAIFVPPDTFFPH
jgi:hypothetical protein